MNAIDIHLENFEGRDLLMHLIKKNNLDTIYRSRR